MRGFTSEDRRRKSEDEPDVVIEGALCEHHTERAILVRVAGGPELWVPQSVVCDESEVYATGHSGKLIVRAWFARKAGLSD